MDRFLADVHAFGLALTAVQQQQFATYLALLMEWNARINLTAVREPDAILQRHFLDALTCVPVIGEGDGRRLIDVGSGAGFPGLPLKIYFPGLHLTLVESVAKKAQFLQAVVNALDLTAVQIVAERAEWLGQQPAYRERYDWAVGRGVAEMRVLVEYLLPFCRVGGRLLAQKGEHAAAEAKAAAAAVRLLGGGEVAIHPVQLPRRPQTHYLVVVNKIASTPEKYPRRAGIPAKRPL